MAHLTCDGVQGVLADDVGGPVKALVLWADATSPNLGVRALAEGSAALLRRAFPDAVTTTQNYGAGSAPVRMGDLRALGQERLTGRGGLKDWLSQFDLAVDTRSGDSFADIYGLQRLVAMSAAADAVRAAGVPVVLGPQTVGPFDTRAGRVVGRRSLRRATLVMARDGRSAEAAAALGRPVDVLTTDVVFALDAPTRTTAHDVLLNVSGLLWRPGPHVDSSAYRAAVTAVRDGLLAAGRRVTLLAHVLENPSPDDDVSVVRQLAQEWNVDAVVPEGLADVRSAVAGAELVIGSRMHACLNALSVGTPALPLAYSRKFAPLLERLDWTHVYDLRSGEDVVAPLLAAAADDQLGARAGRVRDRAQELLEPATAALRRLG